MTLCDAIDQDKFLIYDKAFSDEDIQAMDIDALETLKMQITKKINGLSAVIKERQIEYAHGGNGASKAWYMSRKYALSINQRVLTYVNSILKKRIRQRRTLGDYFMDSAKEILPREEFERILADAHSEKEARARYEK